MTIESVLECKTIILIHTIILEFWFSVKDFNIIHHETHIEHVYKYKLKYDTNIIIY